MADIKIDYPANTSQLYFNAAYRYELENAPERNGDNVTYGRWTGGRPGDIEDAEPVWSELGYATGSDYSGSLVERSNYEGLAELLEEHHPEGSEPVVWCRTHGGHGTYGLLVRYELLAEEVREAIDGLEDDPLLNDDAYSTLELEASMSAWDSWAKRDFENALAKAMGVDDFPEGIDSGCLFDTAAEAAGEYWVNEQGPDMWICVEKVAAKCVDLLATDKQCPEWMRGCAYRMPEFIKAREAFAAQLANETAAAGAEV